jgi:hypothetical protein
MQVFPLTNVVMVLQMVVTWVILEPMLLFGYLGFPSFQWNKARSVSHSRRQDVLKPSGCGGSQGGAGPTLPLSSRIATGWMANCHLSVSTHRATSNTLSCTLSFVHDTCCTRPLPRRQLFWISMLYTGNTAFALVGLKTLNVPM